MNAAAILCALALTGCATVSTESRVAEAAAWADAGTTAAAVTAGAVEANPLLSASPTGVAAVLATKLIVVKLSDRIEDPGTRAGVLRLNTSLWGGAAASNAAILFGASNPLGLLVGIGTGLALWRAEP